MSLIAAADAADAYPTKPMELTVAYQPGGGSDGMARAMAEALRPIFTQDHRREQAWR